MQCSITPNVVLAAFGMLLGAAVRYLVDDPIEATVATISAAASTARA
jgi:ethanolamine utilization microcompartment shell protein EutL